MFNRKTLAALYLLAVACAPWLVPAAYSAVWQWSTTASSNGAIDAAINFREGQPPSSLNDSNRAVMAALASYRDDISGLLTTGGTSTAYTVATNQGLCASPSTVPQDGQQLSVTMSATNGTGATLQADSCNTYPIQSAAGTGVPAASLISGSPYTLRFSVANSAWMLRDFYGSAFTVPLGGLVPYTGTTSPNSNFVLPAGQCLSTTTYAAYWALLGSPASGSCSGGQFAIIDMRGKVPAALDNLNGTAANILTSSSTGCGTAMTSVGATCANGTQSFAMAQANLPNVNFTISGITLGNGAINLSGSPFSGSCLNNAGYCSGGSQFDLMATNVGSTSSGQPLSNVTVTSQGTAASGGSGTAMPRVQPTVAVTYLLRVL